MLEECDDDKFHPCQFGFIPNRGTNMAITLAHDVSEYCLSRGSTIFMCSLDAEAAYDGISHCVLLYKAMDVMPKNCWNTLYYWYCHMGVQVRWNGTLGPKIAVQKGTRQGYFIKTWLLN